MAVRRTTISYSFENTGEVSHTFYVWVYLYDEQNWAWKSGFKRGPVALDAGRTASETLSKTVDLVPGHTYRAVVAVYKDSSYRNKLDEANSQSVVRG